MQLYTTITSGPKPHPLDITFPKGTTYRQARKETVKRLNETGWPCVTLASTSGKEWHVSATQIATLY